MFTLGLNAKLYHGNKRNNIFGMSECCMDKTPSSLYLTRLQDLLPCCIVFMMLRLLQLVQIHQAVKSCLFRLLFLHPQQVEKNN